MPNEQLQEQALIQSVYMDYLLTKANDLAAHKRPISFDPQGRLLVDVTLTAQDYHNIARKVSQKSDGNINIEPSPQGLMMGIGRKFEEGKPLTTTVSLDAQGPLKELFHEQLKASLKKTGLGEGPAKQVIEKLEAQPKGSIIALQQEMHFHLALASRVYQQKVPEKAGLIEKSHEAAMARVNELVMDAYAKALKKASNNGKTALSLSALNKAMDEAREEIAPQAHVFLIEEMMKRGVKRDDIRDANYKKLTEGTTASPNDVLHVDPDLGTATLIEGSENTAHHRVAGGEHLATRQMMTHYYTGDGIAPNVNSRIQIRTPSIDEKKKLSEEDSIIDIKRKLEYIAEKHKFSEALESVPGKKPAAFVYNLHTALEHFAGDRGGNLQSQGATRILQGAHQYNAEQLAKQRKDGELPVFCFVQNISVNGFGKELGDREEYPLVKEAALMSELAMLHTLYNSSPENVKPQIEGVFKKYEAYLNDPTPNKNVYFSQSDQGKACLEQINQIKSDLRNPQPEIPLDTKEKVTRALQQIFANNLHEQHQYSKLTQALSIYLEEGSISGCKSGNERAQAVNGRVAILDAALAGRLGAEGLAIRESLDALSTGNNSPEHVETLKNSIDIAYNKYGLQGAASIVSLLDQGAAAKVKGKKDGSLRFQSTNNAEENKSIMTNLHQSHAGDMQAHKGAPDAMQKAVEKVHGRTFGQFMKDMYSSIGWGIIATVFLPITLLVGAGMQISANNKEAKNEQIHQQFLKEQAAMVAPKVEVREEVQEQVHHEPEKGRDLGLEVNVVQSRDWRTNPPTPTSMGDSGNSPRDMRAVSRRFSESLDNLKGLQTPLLDKDNQQDSELSDSLRVK